MTITKHGVRDPHEDRPAMPNGKILRPQEHAATSTPARTRTSVRG